MQILPLDDGPFHKKSMWDGYTGVATFRKYYNLGFIKHLELSIGKKYFAGTNPIAVRIGTY